MSLSCHSIFDSPSVTGGFVVENMVYLFLKLTDMMMQFGEQVGAASFGFMAPSPVIIFINRLLFTKQLQGKED